MPIDRCRSERPRAAAARRPAGRLPLCRALSRIPVLLAPTGRRCIDQQPYSTGGNVMKHRHSAPPRRARPARRRRRVRAAGPAGRRRRVRQDAGVLLRGQPGELLPGVNTTGTSFDANSQIYSRIVDFERGTTKVVPGLAERWDISPDGKVYTFHLRKGVKWHNHRAWKPTRDLNADDIIFMLERQWKEDNPYFKVTSSEPLVLQRHGHAQAAEVGREGRRLHGPDHARTSPRRRSCRTSRWSTPACSRRNTPTRC